MDSGSDDDAMETLALLVFTRNHLGGQLVLMGTAGPRTTCPRGTAGPRTRCLGDSWSYDQMSGGQQVLGPAVRGDTSEGGQPVL